MSLHLVASGTAARRASSMMAGFAADGLAKG